MPPRIQKFERIPPMHPHLLRATVRMVTTLDACLTQVQDSSRIVLSTEYIYAVLCPSVAKIDTMAFPS